MRRPSAAVAERAKPWCRSRCLRPVMLAGAAALGARAAFLSFGALQPEGARASPLARGFRTGEKRADGARTPRRLGPGGGSDPVNNVSPEMNAASKKYGRRLEDVFLSGHHLFDSMKKVAPGKRIYVIGTNGNAGEEVADSLAEALGYVPAPDGTFFIHRKPGDSYTPTRYQRWHTDKKLAEKSTISAVDLFVQDEDKYRDLETEVLREFDAMEDTGYPELCVVGEGAVLREENIEIMKKGVVIWLDVDPKISWVTTQMKPQQSGGLYIPPEFHDRPPVWCIANGWDGDVDDSEGRTEYYKVLAERRQIYDNIADIRLRTDLPGIAENSYWGAERLVKALREHFGISTDDVSVEEEVLETDLEKFLEGARLSKYLKPALAWCEEQGAASIEDIVENAADFGEALALKPLEKKRLQKAAATVVVA